MKGLGKSLRYWSYILEPQFLKMLLSMSVIVVLMTAMEGGDFKTEIAEVFPAYCILMMVMTAFMNALNGSSIYFPISISLGATRKSSCIAVQIIQHFIMAEYVLVGVVVMAVIDPENLSPIMNNAFLLIGVIALLIGVANIVTIVNFKYGKKAAMIAYFVIVALVFGCYGVWIAVYENSFAEVVMGTLIEKQYLGLIGLIFDAVIMTIFYKVVKKSNLQF